MDFYIGILLRVPKFNKEKQRVLKKRMWKLDVSPGALAKNNPG